MMLKVAFITDAPRIAGSEIWLLETLPKLPQYGLEPAVFLPTSPGGLRLKELLEARGIPAHPYPNLDAIPGLTQNHQVRILQAWYATTYGLLKKLPSPKVVFLHDQLEYHYPLGIKRLYQFIYGVSKAAKLKDADAVLVGTRWAAHYLRRHFGLETQVVPVGVDPYRFRPPSPEERQALRSLYQFSRFTLLTPARFTLEKNHLAVLLTARLTPDADFVLVGEGSWSKGLRLLARALNLSNARFLGKREDIAELYRAADAVLFPTLGDNPGLVILEGMASGIPVITSPFPPQREVISLKEGLLVPPHPRNLSWAVRWLMENPQGAWELGMKGRQRILSERTVDGGARALATVLHGLSKVPL